MEITMTPRTLSLRALAGFAAVAALSACTPHSSFRAAEPAAVSNPPPVAPGPMAIWYHVEFANDSFTIDPAGQKVVNDVAAYLMQNPKAEATIIGKTDNIGSQQYNMHLSHQRADAVRDALVYSGKIAATRVETRWTGEQRQTVATPNDAPAAGNRVVDIAIH
jgi:outer membrane protein OmpA-like peptidoglycan-associated protein